MPLSILPIYKVLRIKVALHVCGCVSQNTKVGLDELGLSLVERPKRL